MLTIKFTLIISFECLARDEGLTKALWPDSIYDKLIPDGPFPIKDK